MATLTITDVDAVRSEGSLKAPSESSGAATDRQIQAAIRAARRRMIEKLTYADPSPTALPGEVISGEVLYEATQAFTDGDLANEDKDEQYDALTHAESCFAIAHLFRKLNSQQLSASGLIQSIEIGKARQSFAAIADTSKLGAEWETEAMRWLTPYITAPVDAMTKAPTSFSSRKGSFYMAGI